MIKTFDALHDTPHGTVPGVAVAVYGHGSPEAVHTTAAWIGLTGDLPGIAVFHVRPTGPDSLHRMRLSGSGLDIRAWLDRAGLKDRVLLPHKTGFDVLIPDRGSVLDRVVRAFAKHHGVEVEASRGHFSQVGSQDQAKARATFRNKIAASERGQEQVQKKARPQHKESPRGEKGVLTSDQEAMLHEILHKGNHAAFGGLGDSLQESGFPTVGSILSRIGENHPQADWSPSERHFRRTTEGTAFEHWHDGNAHRVLFMLPNGESFKASHSGDPSEPYKYAAGIRCRVVKMSRRRYQQRG